MSNIINKISWEAALNKAKVASVYLLKFDGTIWMGRAVEVSSNKFLAVPGAITGTKGSRQFVETVPTGGTSLGQVQVVDSASAFSISQYIDKISADADILLAAIAGTLQ